MKQIHKLVATSLLCGPALLLSACDDSSNGGDSGTINIGLPEGLYLSLLNATDGTYYGYDSTTGVLTDLNEKAATSQDESIQNMQITDTSVIGHFLHWPLASEEHEEEAAAEEEEHAHEEGELEMYYLLMYPEYQPGSAVDADSFSVIAHFHDADLAAHTSEDFRDAEAGSQAAEMLEMLNAHVAEQLALEDEISEVLPAGQTLCRAYIDPVAAAELAHEEEAAGEEEAHDHGELVHFALTDTGRVYFYEEHEGALEQLQGFVTLDDVAGIEDCTRTTIARASDDGVLVFVPDTQTLYLVDAHDGGNYHQHSSWAAAELMPEGSRADLIAILGEGESDHDHDHE